MNLFQALAHAGHGLAESAAAHQLKTDPRIRREMNKKARARADKCSPCVAGAYIANLQKTFGSKR